MKRIRRIDEIAHNWKVRRTLSGKILDETQLKKISEGIAGLTKHSQALQKSLTNPNLNPTTRKAIQQAVDTAVDLINRAINLIN